MDYMGKDLRGMELGVGLYQQRKDKRYSARYTNQYGKRMEFYDFKLSVVKKCFNDARYEDEHVLSGKEEKVTVTEWFEKWIKQTVKEVDNADPELRSGLR